MLIANISLASPLALSPSQYNLRYLFWYLPPYCYIVDLHINGLSH